MRNEFTIQFKTTTICGFSFNHSYRVLEPNSIKVIYTGSRKQCIDATIMLNRAMKLGYQIAGMKA
jgi:hypothetical protein